MGKFKPLTVLFLLFLGIAVYGIALNNPYYYDDYTTLKDNAWLRNLWPPLGWFGSFYFDSNHIFTGFRPVLMLSFWTNLHLLGDSPTSFRIGNLALHVANAYLLVQIVKKLVGEHQKAIAWFSGVLFLLHPIQTIAINFLWKRSTLLETTIILFSMFIHARERERGIYRRSVVLLQLGLYFFALMTKESGGVLPLYLVVLDLSLFGFRAIAREKRVIGLLVGMFAMALAYFSIRFHLIPQWYASHIDVIDDGRQLSRSVYFLSALAAIPKYVWLWVSPSPRIIDDPAPTISVYSFPVFLFLLLTVSSATLGFWFRKTKFVPCLIAFFWISFLPVIGVVPLYYSMDQIRMYIPIAVLSTLVTAFLFNIPALTMQFKCITLILLSSFYAVFTVGQNIQYANPERIWEDVVEEYPKSELAWNQYGIELQHQNHHASAAHAFARASEINPTYDGYKVRKLKSLFTIGVSASKLRSEANLIFPNKLSSLDQINLAILQAELGNQGRAEQILLKLVERQPTLGLAHLNLAILWERMGQIENAKLAYKNAALLTH